MFVSDQVEVLFDDGIKYTAPISDVRKRVSFIFKTSNSINSIRYNF